MPSLGIGLKSYLSGMYATGARSVASPLVLNLLFTTATVASGTVTDVDGTGDVLTYTGASHKRQWNADGVLEYAPHNLLSWSVVLEDFDNPTYWGTIRTTVEQGGSVSAPSIGGTVHSVTETTDTGDHSISIQPAYRGTISPIGDRVTVRYFVNPGDYSRFRVYAYQFNNHTVVFNATDGTIYSETGGTSPVVEVTADSVSGWVMIEITDTLIAATSACVLNSIQGETTTINYTGDGSSKYYIAAVQVVRENSSPVYIKSSSGATAVYAARAGTRNRRPVTNLNTYPEQFDNAVYTKLRTSVSGGQTDPFGGTNAFKLVENSANNTHLMYGNGNRTHVQNGKVYTVSFFASPSERNWIYVQFGLSPVPANTYGYFDLSNGVAGTVGAGFSSYAMAPVEGTNYYRVWATFTADEDGDIELLFALSSGNNVISYDGDGSSGLYIFGAMLNEGGIEDYVGATNLLTPYDKAFTGGWTPSGTTLTDNAAIAPDGTTTALHMVENSADSLHTAVLNTGVSVTANTLYNLSFFFKPGARTVCTARFDAGSGYFSNGAGVYFDTVTGVATQIPAGWSTSMTYWGNGWWLCGLSSQHDATVNIRCALGLADSTTGSSVGDFYTGDGTSDGYFWGAQLTKGSTLYPYVGMQQTGFVNAGYTAEAAATNLVTDSEDLGAAFWTKANATITTNAITAPDGLSTADILGDDGATGSGEVRATRTFTVANSTTYTYSVFAKAAQLNWLKFRVLNFTTPINSQAHFDVAAGVLGTIDAGFDDAGIIPCGNGWYRCWISFTTDAVDTIGDIYNVVVAADGGFTVPLDGTSDIYMWGAQFETGTYPSSYIATSGGTATRAADFLEDETAAWIKDESGTFVVHYDRPAGMANYPQLFDASNSASSTTNRVDAYFSSTGTVTGRSTGANLATAASPANAFAKFASAYALDDCNIAINGTVSVADTAAALPSGLNQLSIGSGDAGGNEFGGYIKSLQYYNIRKSDADLATLSTITDDGTAWVDEQMAV